jgi:hypothetical protein
MAEAKTPEALESQNEINYNRILTAARKIETLTVNGFSGTFEGRDRIFEHIDSIKKIAKKELHYEDDPDKEFQEKHPDIVKLRGIEKCYEIDIKLIECAYDGSHRPVIGMSGIDTFDSKPTHATVYMEEEMTNKTIFITGKDLKLKNNFAYGT